jgi:hypothetical protein
MDYKTQMKKDKKRIVKVKIKLRKAIIKYKKCRRKRIIRAMKYFVKDWRENLNFVKIFRKTIKEWKAQKKLNKKMHEYVKLCGKSKW